MFCALLILRKRQRIDRSVFCLPFLSQVANCGCIKLLPAILRAVVTKFTVVMVFSDKLYDLAVTLPIHSRIKNLIYVKAPLEQHLSRIILHFPAKILNLF